jgi:hypothetical protein
MKRTLVFDLALTTLAVLGLATAQPAAANNKPVLDSFTINGKTTNITINEGDSISAQFSATDHDLNDIVDFYLRQLDQLGNTIKDQKRFYVGTGTVANPSNPKVRTLDTTLNLAPLSDNGTFYYRGRAFNNSDVRSDFIRRTITVNNVAPTLLNFDLSSGEIFEGQLASITASFQATDPGADAITFLFDGEEVGTDNATTGTRTHSFDFARLFEDDGDFEMNGQAKDDDGGFSATVKSSLKVFNVAPTINSLSKGLFGRRLDVSAIAIDPGIKDLLTVEWDFNGDGKYDYSSKGNGGSINSDYSWTYDKNGRYEVGVRVSDGDGGFAEDSFEVQVSVPEPSSLLGVLAFAAFGTSSVLKRKKAQ